ncbi:MAG: hypothetical protein KJZ86_18755, partial [Caldilineaceae bacterium]|nr:hypothetical protein [Caldilineaceae bacterium]
YKPHLRFIISLISTKSAQICVICEICVPISVAVSASHLGGAVALYALYGGDKNALAPIA